jgi:aminopeptidase N
MRTARITLALLLLAGCQAAPDAGPPPAGVDVQRYEVDLALDPDALTVAGTATLYVLHPDTLPRLALRLDGPAVSAVRVNGVSAGFDQDATELVVPLSPSEASIVAIDYSGKPETGLFAGVAEGQRVVWTDGWPLRTAGWLPGLHHPSDAARLDLTVRVPPPYEVAASGTLETEAVAEDGTTASRFVLGRSAPVYTFAFAAADFSRFDQTGPRGLPIHHYLLDAGEARALRRTPQILAFFEGLLGPYPYASYGTAAVPHQYAGMENAARPFLRADLYGLTRETGEDILEEVNVHEVAHQWLGNRVRPADWSELWLAEGSASYLTALFYEAADGPDAFRRQLVRSAQLPDADARRALRPDRVRQADEMLGATVYQKGAAVFHLLRLTLGDDAFRRALRAVYAEYDGRTLTTEAFQATLEQASGRDLDQLFDTWVYAEGRVTLRLSHDARAGRLSWRVEGDEGTLSELPVEVLVNDGDGPRYVPLSDGGADVSGTDRPAVAPVGVPMRLAWG